MQCRRHHDGSITLTGVNKWHLSALQNVSALADPGGHKEAAKRVYPPPVVAEDATPEMLEDWDKYVRPEIKALFDGSLEIMAQDVTRARLEQAHEITDNPPDDENSADAHAPHYTIVVAADHVDHWYRALNQARLCMSARHGIDSENRDQLLELLVSGKMEVLFQYEFFTGFQSWLVEAVMSRENISRSRAEAGEPDVEQAEHEDHGADDEREGENPPPQNGQATEQ